MQDQARQTGPFTWHTDASVRFHLSGGGSGYPHGVLISDPHNLKICCRVNGEVVQSSNTSQMVFKTEELIAWVSQ